MIYDHSFHSDTEKKGQSLSKKDLACCFFFFLLTKSSQKFTGNYFLGKMYKVVFDKSLTYLWKSPVKCSYPQNYVFVGKRLLQWFQISFSAFSLVILIVFTTVFSTKCYCLFRIKWKRVETKLFTHSQIGESTTGNLRLTKTRSWHGTVEN